MLGLLHWLFGVALGDCDAGGVPQGAGVVPVAVQREHGVDDVLGAAVLVDDAAEVARVLLAGADALGQVGRAGAGCLRCRRSGSAHATMLCNTA
jgi:hypothetical protein